MPRLNIHSSLQAPACEVAQPAPVTVSVAGHKALIMMFSLLKHRPSCACSAIASLAELPQLLAASQHATFHRVLAPLLLPCLAAVTQHLSSQSGIQQLEVRNALRTLFVACAFVPRLAADMGAALQHRVVLTVPSSFGMSTTARAGWRHHLLLRFLLLRPLLKKGSCIAGPRACALLCRVQLALVAPPPRDNLWWRLKTL